MIFLDVETTSFSYNGSFEIIQLYAYDELEREEFEVYIKPVRYNDESYSVHKISKEFLSNKQPMKDCMDIIHAFLERKKKRDFFCYAKRIGNSLFDLSAIQICYAVYRSINEFDKLELKFHSVHDLARSILKLDNYSQESVYYELFKRKYKAHNARSDVIALREIYYELLKKKEDLLI